MSEDEVPLVERDTAPDRNETVAERIDRNWGELLQELRVTQTGVQILFAFLLVLPFQQRFDVLGDAERWLYLVVVLLMTISTSLNLAPVITHRLLFRRHKKDVLLEVSDRLAKWSFISLGLALVGAVALVVDVVVGPAAALGAVAVVALLILGLWVVLPWVLLRQHEGDGTPRY